MRSLQISTGCCPIKISIFYKTISSIRKRINNQILKLKVLSLSSDYRFEFREAMDVFILRMLYVFKYRSLLRTDPLPKGVLSVWCTFEYYQAQQQYITAQNVCCRCTVCTYCAYVEVVRIRRKEKRLLFLTETCSFIIPAYNIVLND